MKCKWCRGTGENRSRYGPVPCPDCDGTGYLQEPDEETEAEEEEEEQTTEDPALS